jgi:hypothetical protein
MPREPKLPKRLQPMLATLAYAPLDNPVWVLESKRDGFRMVASTERGEVALYSRNGTIISDSPKRCTVQRTTWCTIPRLPQGSPSCGRSTRSGTRSRSTASKKSSPAWRSRTCWTL